MKLIEKIKFYIKHEILNRHTYKPHFGSSGLKGGFCEQICSEIKEGLYCNSRRIIWWGEKDPYVCKRDPKDTTEIFMLKSPLDAVKKTE